MSHGAAPVVLFKCMYVYLLSVRAVAHKTITISIEAYRALLRLKGPKESFTDVILRLVSRGSLVEFAGKWRGDPRELEDALSELRSAWRRWGVRIDT